MLKWECEEGVGIDVFKAPAFSGHYELTVAKKLKNPLVNLCLKIGNSVIPVGEDWYSLAEIDRAKEDAATHAASWVYPLLPENVVDLVIDYDEYSRRGKIIKALAEQVRSLRTQAIDMRNDIEIPGSVWLLFNKEVNKIID